MNIYSLLEINFSCSPLLEVQEDLPQSTSSTDHVQVNSAQKGEVNFDYILSEHHKKTSDSANFN